MVLHMEQIYTNFVMIFGIKKSNRHEHADPWIKKGTGECERIAAFKSKYNRLVAFDGYRYDHGMSVDDDRWFYETRVNQVMFFDDRRF